MIVGIVAVGKNGAIGKDGRLPWHYATDMKFFRKTTISHACVMGYKTWLTLKRPLKDRLNIVLSRQADIGPQDSVITVRDVPSVLSVSRYLRCDLFVIGGAKVYQSFLPDIEKWIVTEVPLIVEGADTFVPENYLEGFEPIGSCQLDEGLTVRSYERVKPS
jgi:dihydrofolate reductase